MDRIDSGYNSAAATAADLDENKSIKKEPVDRNIMQFMGLIHVQVIYELICLGLPSYEPEYIWNHMASHLKVSLKDVIQALQILQNLNYIKKDGDKYFKTDVEAWEENENLFIAKEEVFKITASKMLAMAGILAGTVDNSNLNSKVFSSGGVLYYTLNLGKGQLRTMLDEIQTILIKYDKNNLNLPLGEKEIYHFLGGCIQTTDFNFKKGK